jgi:hypothetical protein
MLLDENPVPLALLARKCPPTCRTGRPPHPSVLWRWSRSGLRTRTGRRVVLEACKAGGTTVSSEAALRRFFAALEDGERAAFPEAAPRASAAELAATSRALVAAGLKKRGG